MLCHAAVGGPVSHHVRREEAGCRATVRRSSGQRIRQRVLQITIMIRDMMSLCHSIITVYKITAHVATTLERGGTTMEVIRSKIRVPQPHP